MDGQYWILLLKIIVFLPFIIFAIYLSLKLGGSKLQAMQNGRFIKVLERVPISKDSCLLVVKAGEKMYLLSSSSGGMNVLEQLDQEEVEKYYEAGKQIINSNLNDSIKNLSPSLYNLLKNFKKKEE